MLDENLIAELARRGIATETFRRLPPDKKERIYRAAIGLFGMYGYDGLSVDQLCREAAISKGSFFQYFPSKSHLLEFAVLMFDDFLAKWMNELRLKETVVLARERLWYLYEALVVNSKLYPEQERFFLFVTRGLEHAGVRLEGIDLEQHFDDYIAEIIRRGEQTGEIRGDFDVELTAHLTSLIMAGLVRRRYSGRRQARRETAEYLISFVFDGIKACVGPVAATGGNGVQSIHTAAETGFVDRPDNRQPALFFGHTQHQYLRHETSNIARLKIHHGQTLPIE